MSLECSHQKLEQVSYMWIEVQKGTLVMATRTEGMA